jgi:DNA primase
MESMGMVPREVVDQVRQANDIVDIIGSVVPLKRAGSRYKALSPFNKEKTPSFYVDPAKQIFKCFSSGHGGDVFKFLMIYDNLDFPAALRRLAERANINLPESGGEEDGQDRSQRERLFLVHAAVTAWWKQLLHKDPAAEPARAYLKSRDIPSDLAREFDLGYSPDSWDATLQWGKSHGYDVDLLELAGLVKRGDQGKPYDHFRGRLMFPVSNEGGQVVAFSGRLLDPEAKAAKYVNSPETPIFSKSKILFGLNKTKRAILEAKQAIVCEGQIDLIRCYEKGIQNVVAPQGTAFTEYHARLIKRFAEEAVLLFDADNAGQRAAERSVEILIAGGVTVRLATLPPGEDPDTLLRKGGAEALHPLIQAAPDYTRHLLDLACRENNLETTRGRTAAAEKMAQLAIKIPSPTQRQTFALQTAARLQVPLATFLAEMEKIKKIPSSQRDEEEIEVTELEIFTAEPVVKGLLSLLLTHPELIANAQRQLQTQALESVEGGSLVLEMMEAHVHDEWAEAGSFVATRSEGQKNYLAGLLLDPVHLPQEASLNDYLNDLIQSVHQQWKRQRLQILEQEIKSNLLTPPQLLEKSQELLTLRRG